VSIAYETNSPGNIVSWLVLSLPELGTKDLAKRVAHEYNGIDGQFLNFVSDKLILSYIKCSLYLGVTRYSNCNPRQENGPRRGATKVDDVIGAQEANFVVPGQSHK
jgi:hypothetical protein